MSARNVYPTVDIERSTTRYRRWFEESNGALTAHRCGLAGEREAICELILGHAVLHFQIIAAFLLNIFEQKLCHCIELPKGRPTRGCLFRPQPLQGCVVW